MVLLNGSQERKRLQSVLAMGVCRQQAPAMKRFWTIRSQLLYHRTWTSVNYDSASWKWPDPFIIAGKKLVTNAVAHRRSTLGPRSIPAADTYTITTWCPLPLKLYLESERDLWSGRRDKSSLRRHSINVPAVTNGMCSPSAAITRDMAYGRMFVKVGAVPRDALPSAFPGPYNDGSSATTVTLQPLDGIILRRLGGFDVYLPLILKK